ncbi:MAG TPA: DUF779 domain-containing protein [Dongiaceae bacterium]|nr:DUF779 domain-containing protein [Dongiaceae bacterium]
MSDTAVTNAPASSSSAASTAYVPRVIATASAEALIEKLRGQHGPVLFHQSGGCCDGSSPMCYPVSEFIIGDSDILLGNIAGADFYISGPQFEYWQYTQLNIDVVPGRGGMFSLENGHDLRFLTRSRIYSDDELDRLTPIRVGQGPG